MKIYLMAFALLFSTTLFAENKTPTENKHCVSQEQTMDEIYENGAITHCLYDGLTITQAYSKYISEYDEDFLEKTIIVGNDFQKEYANESVTVNYKWNSPQKLLIEQQFAGGVTELLLEEENNTTNITIKRYPD